MRKTQIMRFSPLSISIALAIVILFPVAGAAQLPPACGGPAEAGKPIHDLSLGEPCEYTFEGEAGEVVTVAVNGEAEGFDPRVWLLDPDGEEEAFDDDSGGDGNSLIAEHELKRTGTYVVRVGSYDNQGGRFEISLERVSAAAEPETEDEEPGPETHEGDI